MITRLIFSLICSLLVVMTARAAESVDGDNGSSGVKVSMLTARAGADVYQLEGHTALRIQTPLRGDYVVNWGLFDFAAPNFLYRFVKGETDYMAGAARTEYFLEMYRREGRTVVEQVLDLTSAEAARVIELTDRNLQPENRVYRYNYVLDNCATRPLAVIEKAIGDTLTLNAPSTLPADVTLTFRDAMRYYHANYPWYQFGIDLALGNGIDRPISTHEATYAPETLEKLLATAVRTDDGSPIVNDTVILVGGEGVSPVLAPTPWMLSPMFWACVTLAIAVLLAVFNVRLKRIAKIFDTLLFAALGIAGCLVAYLVFISVHEATSPNFMLLWLNPLCFISAICLWVKSLEKLVFCYQILNFASLIVLLVLLVAGVQSPNPAFIPLIMADGVRALSCILTTRNNARCHHHPTNQIS